MSGRPCDRCGSADRVHLVEVVIGPEPCPRLSVSLCQECRVPLALFVAGMQAAILAGIQ